MSQGLLVRSTSGGLEVRSGPKVRTANFGIVLGTAQNNVTEPADKPGFVVDSHSSRRIVTDTLKQPTRSARAAALPSCGLAPVRPCVETA